MNDNTYSTYSKRVKKEILNQFIDECLELGIDCTILKLLDDEILIKIKNKYYTPKLDDDLIKVISQIKDENDFF